MAHSIQRDDANLIAVGASILSFTQSLGVFHYNKLVYLFEYFYIKNFGRRFTKEVFVKLPHGPVIKSYKNHIRQLTEIGAADVDLKVLLADRSLTDDFNERIEIRIGEKTDQFVFQDAILRSFTESICSQFAGMDVGRLEKVVYQTDPMKKFCNSPFKKQVGGYILTSDMIRLSDHKSPETEGRRIAHEHLRDHPDINFEQQKELSAEFSPLNDLRPAE